VDAKSNERYIIRQVKAMAEIASKPLVIMMVMRRMPETSPAMEVPIAAPLEQFEDEVQECPSEVAPLTQNFPDLSKEIVKSKEAADDQGWRRGLKTEPW
jgi:hypothetical protein